MLLTELRPPTASKYPLVQNDQISEERQPFLPPQRPATIHSVGKPAYKPLLSPSHAIACCVSIVCSIVAVMCVTDTDIAWRLGVGNRQLIVLGFLLGIMNLCLSTVSPFFLLILEARFGKSTLQNYSGLLQTQIFAPQMTFYWRAAHFTLLALPISLSVGYKSFNGGSSGKHFNTTAFLGTQPCYGIFAPPGLAEIDRVGVTFFSNATVPYNIATSPTAGDRSEPPLPVKNQAYGFNTLMVNNNVTAFLDIPEPSYVSFVQAKLATGESWNVSATVYGTVATFDESKLPSKNRTFFTSICEASNHGLDWGALIMFNDRTLHLLVPLGSLSPIDNSLAYVGITPNNITDNPYNCDKLADYAQPFRITRQVCNGTWTVTRGGFQLKSGSCSGVPAEPQRELQRLISNTYLALPHWYMGSLMALMEPFNDNSGPRNQSKWLRPYMTTSTAGIMWSRLVFITGTATEFNSTKSLLQHVNEAYRGTGSTWQEMGILYPNNDTVTYVRPTLDKSTWLYLILSIQSFLTIIMLLVSTSLYSTPISQNFGFISILSGLNGSNLDIVAGAGLSGKLSKDIHLSIRPIPQRDQSKQMLDYQLVASSGDTKNDARLTRNTVYN